MINKQISLGRIEFFDQSGMSYLLDDLYYNLSKVHSISPEEMLAISPEKALFIFCGGNILKANDLVCSVYQKSHDEDGFLYLIYSGEATFG